MSKDRVAAIIPFPADVAAQKRPIANLARRLAVEIANEADADQWAIAVDGVHGTGQPDFQELVPRQWLEALNHGRPAAYRLTLVLRHESQDLGTVRLATVRPPGFTQDQIATARNAADQAARLLSRAISRSTQWRRLVTALDETRPKEFATSIVELHPPAGGPGENRLASVPV